MDAIAFVANTALPRFFTRFAESRAEAEDAFAVGDWGCSTYPACGKTRLEVLFAYPPSNLLNRFVLKAQADGVLAVVVTPSPSPLRIGPSFKFCGPPWSRTRRATSACASRAARDSDTHHVPRSRPAGSDS